MNIQSSATAAATTTTTTDNEHNLPVFIFEGLIAAGKSTLLQKLQLRNPTWCIFLEPVEDWQRGDLLSNFYKNPALYCFTLQQRVFDSYENIYRTVRALVSIDSSTPILIERSSRAAFRIFTKLARDNNNLTIANYISLNEQYFRNFFSFDLNVQTIYSRIPPLKAFERMLSRNRPEEVQFLSRNYMSQLHALHEKEFTLPNSNFKAPLVILDGNFDSLNDAHLTWLENLIKQTIRPNATSD